LCLLAGAGLYRPPYVVLEPGSVADVTGDVAITGVPVTPVNGRYLTTTVVARRTNVLGTLVAVVRDDRRVVGADAAEVRTATSPALSRETRILAAVAAARSQGLSATVTGTGVRVVAVSGGSPAHGVLRVGDVILNAGGEPVTQAAQLAGIVRRSPSGAALALSVDRGGRGRVEEVTVTPAGGGIGITVETRDLAVELPFEVRFEGRAGGGPTVGLAYALTIADLLSSQDVARGRTIVASGAVAGDGAVGPVPGPEAHADAAADGADVFVVAVEEAGTAGDTGGPLQVEAVDSLTRALAALSTTV
jgi:PDZ domain-containing protein